MGKETKIGLAVIGLLLLVFSGLLARRLMSLESATSGQHTAAAAQTPAASPPASVPVPIVVAQKDTTDMRPTGLHRMGADSAATSPADVQPNHGFMPPPEPAAESSPEAPAHLADESPEVTPADAPTLEAPALDEPLPSGAEPAAADEAPLPEADSEIPPAGDELTQTGGAQEIPTTVDRQGRQNPLRRLSASEPLATSEPQATPDEPAEATELEASQDDPAPLETPSEPVEEPVAEAEPAEPVASERVNRDRQFALTGGDSQTQSADDPTQTSGGSEWRPGAGSSAPAEPLPAAEAPAMADGKYTVQPNDSMWLISEKVYGTGGYFKALSEFNRTRLPRADRLTVGAVLVVPPVTTLEQNYPHLCPKQRKSAVVKARTMPASTRGRRAAGDGVYVVAEGDTLFDIARYELGKASRWAEIYELNRDVLGEDFDYLRPGLELTMPGKSQGATDSFTRQGEPLQR